MNRKTKQLFKSLLGEKLSSIISEYRSQKSVSKDMDLKERASQLYQNILERPLNWDNPQDLNEIINWMKFNTDTTKWTELSDKYRVRRYVEECGLSDILVKLYGKWDRADEIDYDKLTYPCILKVNHGCGGNFVLYNTPAEKEQNKIISSINKLLDIPFGYATAEPHYIPIKTCVIAEELLIEKENRFSTSLVDYKVWCFNGKPYYILTTYNRAKYHVSLATYDTQWRYHPEFAVVTSHYRNEGDAVPRPKSLDKMLEAASTLSKGFPQVRVDFYDINGKLYFGEMTFTSQGGYMEYYTPEFLLEMGKQIKLEK